MIEDFKEFLLEEKAQKNTGLIEFYQTDFSDISHIVFVESSKDDVNFYQPILDSYINVVDLIFIECGSKIGVLDCMEVLEESRLKSKVAAILYLVDSDFDLFLGKKRCKAVFYTKFYSVESYLIDEAFMQHILKRFCKVTRQREAERLARKIWRIMEENILDITRIFAAMCTCRSLHLPVDLDQYPIYKIVDFHADGKFKINEEQFYNFISDLQLSSENMEEIAVFERTMIELDFRTWVRGRQAIQLVRKIVSKNFEDSQIRKLFCDNFVNKNLQEFCNSGIKLDGFDEYKQTRER